MIKQPPILRTYHSNPALICYEALLNVGYDLLDTQSFTEWASYCNEKKLTTEVQPPHRCSKDDFLEFMFFLQQKGKAQLVLKEGMITVKINEY